MKERTPSYHVINSTIRWLWIFIALLTIVAIAIGVGVGVWHHEEPSLHKPAVQVILNDTSLAVVSLANGDRQLFFQDNSGFIRSTVRNAINNQWSTSADQNLTFNSNPKNFTPLAVIVNDLSSVMIKTSTVLVQTKFPRLSCITSQKATSWIQVPLMILFGFAGQHLGKITAPQWTRGHCPSPQYLVNWLSWIPL